MLDKRSVNVLKAGSSEVEVLEAHFSELVHYHVHNLVASTEVVVERDGHAVTQTRAADSLFQSDELGALALQLQQPSFRSRR